MNAFFYFYTLYFGCMSDFSAFGISALIYLIIVLFIILLVYRGIVDGMRRMRYSSKNIKTTSITILLILVGWLMLTAGLSLMEIVSPTMLAGLTGISLIGVLYVYKSRKLMQVVQKMPKNWLVNIHFLRIFTEMIMWFMYNDVTHRVPRHLTFEGGNFDIIIALTAPFIAQRCFKARTWPKSYATAWNYLGILFITGIYVMIILTSQSSLRFFTDDYLSSFTLMMPFIWIPTFTLPLFLLFHLLSIKQIKTPVEKEDFIIRKRRKEGKIFEN